MVNGHPQRVAFEAYPGFAARQIVKGSYKNDARAKQTPQRMHARKTIVAALVSSDNPFGFALSASPRTLSSLVRDATGDRLDAVLCALQAAWAWQRRADNYGLPSRIDSLEGWIVMVPEK
jgi:predicted RNase H-like nuclease